MLGNPTRGPRLVPFGSARSAADRLPNGRPSMRVTQRFADLDAYFGDRLHGAIDIANFYCGDEVLAMIRGIVTEIRDPNGALGVRITDDELVVEAWHLSRILVNDGQLIPKGRVIGLAGSTGLSIAGCHTHIRVSTDGGARWRDPWPLLDQNAPKPPPVVLPPKPKPPAQERDLYEWVASMGHQIPKRAVVRAGTTLLKNPDGTKHFTLPTKEGELTVEVIGGTHGMWASRRVGGDGLFLVRNADVVRWL